MSGSQGGVVSTTLTVDDGEFRRSLDAAARLINGHVRAVEQAGRATLAMGQQADRAAGQNRNFGTILGNAGFQVQDFAVQVQGGTSALTALSQQGSQFLGVFGTGGAIAGAVLSVGILAAQLLGLGKESEQAAAEAKKLADEMGRNPAEQFAKAIENANKAITGYVAITETAIDRTRRLRQEQVGQSFEELSRRYPTILEEAQKAEDAARKFIQGDPQNIAEARRMLGNPQGLSRSQVDQLSAYVDRYEELSSQANEAREAANKLRESLADLSRRRSADGTFDLGGLPFGQPPEGSSRPRGGARTIDTVLRDAEALQSAFDRVFDGAETRAEEKISRFADETSRATRNVDELANVGREFATVFTSAFDGLATKGGKLSDVLDRLGLGVARILERQFITKPLEAGLNSLLSGVNLSGIFSSIFGGGSAGGSAGGTASFGGFYADGGPVSAGTSYIVGERGPELFVPNASGSIVPNHALGGSTVFNIDARGAEPGVEARIRAVLAQEAPRLSAYVRGDLAARVNRGGSDALTFGRRRT